MIALSAFDEAYARFCGEVMDVGPGKSPVRVDAELDRAFAEWDEELSSARAAATTARCAMRPR